MSTEMAADRKATQRFSPGAIITIVVVYTMLIGVLDFFTPLGMSFALFYMLGIAFVAWRAGMMPAVVLSVIAAVVMDLNEWKHEAGGGMTVWIMLWNAATRAAMFSGTAFCIGLLTELNRELRGTVHRQTGRYETIRATALDGFVLIDQTGRIRDANDVYCRMLGYTRDELLGLSVKELELVESAADVANHIKRIIEGGGDRFETAHRHKDGSPVHVEVSVKALPGNEGLLNCFARDISDRKAAEGRLRESEARYRSLAESSPDAILVLDRHSRVVYANSAAAHPFGISAEQFIGKTQSELFSGELLELHLKMVSKVFETGEPMRLDEFVPFPTGEKWTETRLVPVFDGKSRVESILVIGVDISDRKRTEWLLQAQRDLALRLSRTSDLDTALLALLQFAVQLRTVDCGGVYFFNEETGELVMAAHQGQLSPNFLNQYSILPPNSLRAEIVRKGQPVYDVYQQFPGLLDNTDPSLQSIAILPLVHEGRILGSLHLGSHAASTIPIQSRIVIETVVAQTAGAIARIRAETERQRLERQILNISDREQARIGQELHDGLCQQLVSLAFDANCLQDELARHDRPEAAQAKRIAQYLDDAITEARHLSRGLFPIRFDAESLPSALKELARGVSVRFGVNCTSECDEPVQASTQAAIHLYRIAQEAVTNAVKHGEAKNIQIRLTTAAKEYVLSVEDDGNGFSGKRSGALGGMGLYIMDYRARSIGGTIRAIPGAGRGAVVSCCVPSLRSEKMSA